jgi:hypothetical protein
VIAGMDFYYGGLFPISIRNAGNQEGRRKEK